MVDFSSSLPGEKSGKNLLKSTPLFRLFPGNHGCFFVRTGGGVSNPPGRDRLVSIEDIADGAVTPELAVARGA